MGESTGPFGRPIPRVTIDEALRSEAKRRERDLELAAWCGLGPDEVGPFLRRVLLFDLRSQALAEEEALGRARTARRKLGRTLSSRLTRRL